jgi:DNA invertase Pin-like site-specific DNA recombinase
MRQIAGSFAQYEKNRLVRKLREARERSGKLGGRKSLAEARPETVALAKELHARGLSYRRIAAELAARGHLTSSGKPYMASATRPRPQSRHADDDHYRYDCRRYLHACATRHVFRPEAGQQ